MDELVWKGVLIGILALIVWIGYSCLIEAGRQDEIRQKDWEEFERKENERDGKNLHKRTDDR